MTAEHTRIALPTAKSQGPLPLQLLLLLPVLLPPGVKGKQTAIVSGRIIAIVVVKHFPLGLVLAYTYSGFIQRPALLWRFSFTMIFRGVLRYLDHLPPEGAQPWNQNIV
jgi:ABC-type molybdate transport system permease subunit